MNFIETPNLINTVLFLGSLGFDKYGDESCLAVKKNLLLFRIITLTVDMAPFMMK